MSKKASLFFRFIGISSKFVINYTQKIPINVICGSSASYARRNTVQTSHHMLHLFPKRNAR